MFDLGSFEWSELIAISALALSLWNAFARWNDKQPRVFLSNLYVEFFPNLITSQVYTRLDMDIASLSSEPLPLSHAAVSMDREQWFECISCSPRPDKLAHYGTHACNRNQSISEFFAPPIRFPATLGPSEIRHMTLWVHHPYSNALHNSLAEGLSFDSERASALSSSAYKCGMPLQPHSPNDGSSSRPRLWVRLWVGNRIVLAEVAIDKRCQIPLPM